MFSLRCGVEHVLPRSAKLALAIGVALSVAGCASDEEYRRKVYGDPQQQMAMRGPAPVEVEDDGLPPQVAPRANRRVEPDDPTEPYSPNYGRGSVQQSAVPTAVLPPSPPAIATGNRRADDAYRPPAVTVPAVAGWRRVAGQ